MDYGYHIYPPSAARRPREGRPPIYHIPDLGAPATDFRRERKLEGEQALCFGNGMDHHDWMTLFSDDNDGPGDTLVVRHPLTEADCAEIPTEDLSQVRREVRDARAVRIAAERRRSGTVSAMERLGREYSSLVLVIAMLERDELGAEVDDRELRGLQKLDSGAVETSPWRGCCVVM
jgi:hypothetical protein